MRMTPADYLQAARVPDSVQPQKFGLWEIKRVPITGIATLFEIGWSDYTLLFRTTAATLHNCVGEVVMEDSKRELERHLPIWLAAHGRVLITGLGLGCVVRGLLANPDVEHIDVVEIDHQIIKVMRPEFAGNPRVTIRHGDALKVTWPAGTKWDCAWHDLWTEDGAMALHLSHCKLMLAYRDRIQNQGAWQLPRLIKRRWPTKLLGAA